MAAAMGVSHTSVQRIWSEHGLKPHLVRGFKVSNDPDFVAKVKDVVGLYLDPPANALVLAVDEKSQIQALDRTQPGLPLKKGRAGTMTHDYKRNGTTTLFAALDVATGRVIGECLPRHRAKEFLAFLKTIDRSDARPIWTSISILDNYATHKAPSRCKRWLPAPPPLHPALHADLIVLAQPRRAPVRRDHPPAHPSRNLRQRPPTPRRHHPLDRPPKPKPQTLHLDRKAQHNHCKISPRSRCFAGSASFE